MTSIKYFTDASYSPQTGLGVIVIKKVNGNNITDLVERYKGKKNSELEKIGIEKCYNDAITNHYNTFVSIYTDCKSGINEFDCSANIEINWIKGHCPKKDRITEDEKYFREVDIKARKELRKMTNNINC